MAVAASARASSRPGSRQARPTPAQQDALVAAAKAGVVVVQCSRAASGRVAPRRRLTETGIVAGEDFSPQKARILLMLLLTRTREVGDIPAAFQRY